GEFKLGQGTWYWDINGVYSVNSAKQVMTGNINAARLAQALGPVSECTGECVPFNIFGGLGTITPEMLAYVSFVQRDRSSQELGDISANLSGSLFDLPGGPLGVAIGYEYRHQFGSFDPDPVVAAGLSSDIPALPSRGSFNVHEVYGELNAPLLRDTPFFNLLEASFAARYSDYSTSGSKATMKAGLSWKPVEDLRLRGTWAQGFRAPSIGELYGALSRFDGAASGIVDPCSDLNAVTNQTTRTVCLAQGVPANGSYIASGTGFGLLTGGNRDLKPETSVSWVLGGVYSAGWARNSGFAQALSLEVDYYTIKVDDAIGVPDPNVLVDSCYNRGDALACSAFSRTASGAIAQVRGTLQNLSTIRSEGIDVTFNYRSPPVWGGSFGLSVSNNFLLNYSIEVPTTTGTLTTHYEGTETGSPQAYPRYKGTAVLDFSSNSFNASLTGRYISNVTEPAANAYNVMDSILYLDAQIGFSPSFLNDAFTVTLGVNNLLGTRAPDCLSCGSFDPTTYDMPDQFGYARVAVKF
ncbi:TonB-dependent receptor domain-containing protein, partial [Sphingobium yanoikuyae]